MATEGISEMVCQAISLFVVSTCMIVKVPQILNCLKSTDGLNMKSLLMEFWCFTTLLAYPCSQGYSVTSYLEFWLLTIQDLILLVIVLKKKGLLNVINVSVLVGFLSFVVVCAKGLAPSWFLLTMMTTVTPIGASGKLMQIYTIISNKDAGAVSGLSWALATSTAGGRIVTTLLGSGDLMLVFLSSQATLTNLGIWLTASYYSKPKHKQS